MGSHNLSNTVRFCTVGGLYHVRQIKGVVVVGGWGGLRAGSGERPCFEAAGGSERREVTGGERGKGWGSREVGRLGG